MGLKCFIIGTSHLKHKLPLRHAPLWGIRKFEYAGRRLNRISKYKFWKDDNHAILLEPNEVEKIDQKLNYIHDNPVRAMIVDNPKIIFSVQREIMEVRKAL